MRTTSIRKIEFGGNGDEYIKDKANDKLVNCPYSACASDGRADFLACGSMCAALKISDDVLCKAVCGVGNFTIGAFGLSTKNDKPEQAIEQKGDRRTSNE